MNDEVVFWADTRSEDAASLIVLIGELDLAAVPLVDEQLRRAASLQSSTITLDVSGLTFCDLAGLRALERARAVGATLSGRPDHAVCRLLDATGRAELLPREAHAHALDRGHDR
jgi:anti-anti-sigma factor